MRLKNVTIFIFVFSFIFAARLFSKSSNSYFTSPYLKLLSPNGGEKWSVGSSQMIKWQSENIEKINIEFSSDSGKVWSSIADSVTASDSSFTWTIPDKINAASLIKIFSSADSSIYDISDSAFSIVQAPPTIQLLSPNGGEYWTKGSYPIISWKSKNVTLVKIDLSQDNGATWENIVPYVIAAYSSYSKWQIPKIESNECLIRISKYDDDSVYDVSENVFRITSDSTINNIVVIGSSTAAGVGASTADSAWVSRYRYHLTELNTTVKVINLAVGGYTTYDLMPTGFIPPIGRPSPKTSSNITQALTYNPKAVIINLPSNDVTQGFTLEEQLANYDTILFKADKKDVPVWVSTTQPRNLDAAKRQLQKDMRDSTFARFGDHAIDFWTELANADGTINSSYNSGDGVHLNDAGHRILYERVVEKQIYEQVVSITSTEKSTEVLPTEFKLEQNYPNPFNPTTTIEYEIPNVETEHISSLQLKVYDILGREVATLINEEQIPGKYKVKFNASNLASGVYIYTLKINGSFLSKKMILLK